MTIKEGFYRVELINTVWEVPERYQNLSPVGTGAFGQASICLYLQGFENGNVFRYVLQQTQRDNLQMAHQSK